MKFKIGDEVIVVRSSFFNEDELGWIGHISEFHTSAEGRVYVDFLHIKSPYRYRIEDLELLSVYNSPLYQALR